MSFTDLLTIAMPCYERKEYFSEALESALNQTVKCKIIVVDNCSSHDYFKTVCEEKGVTYYKNEKNIGLYPNINRCFELAETEYVKILDDDDILSPTYVESFLKAKELHPDIDIFFSDYKMLTSKGEKAHNFTLPYGYLGIGHKIIEYGIKYNLGFPYMTCSIRRTKIHNEKDLQDVIGGFDWEWIYSVADSLSFYGDYQKLYSFRIHQNQMHSKEWISHKLTSPYIYEKIFPEKIKDELMLKKATKKANRILIYVKSYSEKKELKKFLNSENKYSKYLKSKLKTTFFLKIIFKLPGSLAKSIFMVIKITNWIEKNAFVN